MIYDTTMSTNLASDSTAETGHLLQHKPNTNEHLRTMAQKHTDQNNSAAMKRKIKMENQADISYENRIKLVEHYRDLCVRLTERLEKAKSKAAQRKQRIQVLEDRNKELADENAALQLKLSQYEMKNHVESNRADNENQQMIPDGSIQVSTEGSADNKEIENGRVCRVSQALEQENSRLRDEIAALKLKLTDRSYESNGGETGNDVSIEKASENNSKEQTMVLGETMEVLTEESQDDEELKNDSDYKTSCWTKRYDELVTYKAEHGDCNVPHIYEANKSLGNWVHNKRKAFKTGELSKEYVKKLNEIGFVWELRKKKEHVPWAARYNELVAYKAEHGDCNVPQRYERNRCLANWVSAQRTAFRNGGLSEERVEKLDEIGFEWKPRKKREQASWTGSYNELVYYKEQHGHCNISQHDEANKRLGSWIHKQRIAFRNGRLCEEYVTKLNEIGFVWKMDGK